jgi:poly(hydroxyalkanoate) depolymerase family esterase
MLRENVNGDRNVSRRCGGIIWRLAILLVAVLSMTAMGLAGNFSEVTGFGTNPGNLRMFKYIPERLRAAPPLVVVLHGGRQSGATYAEEAGWTKFAEQWQFALLLPEQATDNNPLKYFNWFEAADCQKGGREAQSIRQMIEKMKVDNHVNVSAIYVTGLSAGGAMTCVMMAKYPDVFAGGAVIAGLPYGCVTGAQEAYDCMKNGKKLAPSAWGDLVRQASCHAGPWPNVSIWYGSADDKVNPENAKSIMLQWTNVHDIAQIPGEDKMENGIRHRTYKDSGGNPLVETYEIEGMGHGTPVAPGGGPEQGGIVAPFVLDAKICSTYQIGKFWGLEYQPPAIEITAPVQGEVVSGPITIQTRHSDGVSVAQIDFCVDGKVRHTDTGPDWKWEATEATDASHVVVARAIDPQGQVTMSDPVTIVVRRDKAAKPRQGAK